MANPMRTMLEIGPKGKRVVAIALDWPGLERGAKTEEAALERLLAYLPRYAPVPKLAGMQAAFADFTAAGVTTEIVERFAGTGSTDFWGISFGFSAIDQQALSGAGI